MGREQGRELHGACPMDVGWVHNQEQDERVEQEDVGAVTMNTVCHGCGGCGHLQWECPTLQRNEKANRKGRARAKESRMSTEKATRSLEKVASEEPVTIAENKDTEPQTPGPE